MAGTEYVNYFGYASNLLEERMLMSISGATKVGTGVLKDYKLVFRTYNPKWHGHFAHAARCPGGEVWGVIWRVSEQDRQAIHRQESVDIGVYASVDADVMSPEAGDNVPVFFITRQDGEVTMETPPTTAECRPSPQYKAVIVAGARESGLPPHYVTWLDGLPHNGYTGQVDFREIKTNFDK